MELIFNVLQNCSVQPTFSMYIFIFKIKLLKHFQLKSVKQQIQESGLTSKSAYSLKTNLSSFLHAIIQY